MNRVTELKNAISHLFRSGTDAEHDEQEMEGLLDDIDFSNLLQVLLDRKSVV